MVLPIDPGKIKNAAVEVQQNVDVEVHINVYYDSNSNQTMMESFRDFLTQADNTVTINFIDLAENNLYMEFAPDFALVFVGDGKLAVDTYIELRAYEVPCLMLAINPEEVVNACGNSLNSIRKTDLICPAYSTYDWIGDPNLGGRIDFSSYNRAMDMSFKKKMTDWLYISSEAVQVAYAAKFPFLRDAIAVRVINATAIENAGIGAIKLFRGADMPIMTLNQARMILELAAIYNYKVNSDRIIEIVVLVLSAIGFKYLSKHVNKKIKLPSFLIDAAFGFGGTQLLGYAAKEYFARNLAPEGFVDRVKALFK